MSTNYVDTFITVSEDYPGKRSKPPTKPGSIAVLQYALLRDQPYGLTSDDLLFEVYALRNGVSEADREHARETFFAKPQACLRASPLVKSHGFGLHHDREARVAAYEIESDVYRWLLSDPGVTIVKGMRSSRAKDNASDASLSPPLPARGERASATSSSPKPGGSRR